MYFANLHTHTHTVVHLILARKVILQFRNRQSQCFGTHGWFLNLSQKNTQSFKFVGGYVRTRNRKQESISGVFMTLKEWGPDPILLDDPFEASCKLQVFGGPMSARTQVCLVCSI